MTMPPSAATGLARDLSVRLRAGRPLPEALERCAESCPTVAPALRQAAQRLRAGDTLAEVFRDNRTLPAPLARLLASNDASEEMSKALDDAARLMEESSERRTRVSAALAYPQMVAGLFLVMFGIVTVFVVPDLRQMYQGMSLRLPTPTWMVLSLTSPTVALPCVALALLVIVACQSSLSGTRGEEVRMRLPLLGSWLQRQNMVIWLSWMDLLLQRGLPLDEAVLAASEPCPSSAFRDGMVRVAALVVRGTPLSQAMNGEGLCPDMGVWLVSQAETVEFREGRLAKASEVLSHDVDVTTAHGIGVLEPVSMMALGFACLFVAASLLLPLYQLVGGL